MVGAQPFYRPMDLGNISSMSDYCERSEKADGCIGCGMVNAQQRLQTDQHSCNDHLRPKWHQVLGHADGLASSGKPACVCLHNGLVPTEINGLLAAINLAIARRAARRATMPRNFRGDSLIAATFLCADSRGKHKCLGCSA